MELKLIKIGTSKGVILPKKVIDELGLNLGDLIDVKVSKTKTTRDGWKEKFKNYSDLRMTYQVEYKVTYPSGEELIESKLINLHPDISIEDKVICAKDELMKNFYLEVDIKIIKIGNHEIENN